MNSRASNMKHTLIRIQARAANTIGNDFNILARTPRFNSLENIPSSLKLISLI